MRSSIVFLLVACSSGSAPPQRTADDSGSARVDRPLDAAPPDAGFPGAGDPNWASRFDFDGDHIPDPIANKYSGGGHCCYTLSITLSKTHRTIAIPFELDGGYVFGLDLSQPGNFHVEVAADGIASLWMRIATYNGRGEPIPLAWVRDYQIHSHSIRVSFRDGALHVENVMWDCATALASLARLELAGWEGLPPCTLVDLASQYTLLQRGLDRKLGDTQREVETKSVIVDPDNALALQFSLAPDLVRVDVDGELSATSVLEDFGPPEARLPYTLWGARRASSQWVWPARGLAVFVDDAGKTVHHVAVFAPTTLATYRSELRWP